MTLLTKWPAFLQNASGNSTRGTRQRWPESRFQTPTPLLFQNFRIRVRNRVRQFVIFVSPTPVQTPATIIDLGVIYSCFYFRNDNRLLLLPKLKSDPGSGSSFPKFLTPGPDPGPKEKRRFLPESTPVIRIRSHLWYAYHSLGNTALAVIKDDKFQRRARSGLDRTGSGLKPILAGLGLDRTAIFFKIGGSGLDWTETILLF